METKLYVLMHGNHEVALLEFDVVTGYVLRIRERKEEDRLPLRARISDSDLIAWWRDRAVPEAQGSILAQLRQYSIPTTQSYLLRNLGLSLDDHYWVRPVQSSLTWDEVNLFTNDFDESTMSFRGEEMDLFSPAASTGGELTKRWVIENGKRILIKESDGPLSQQSLNEVFASRMHGMQDGVACVSYTLLRRPHTRKLACTCECFTSYSLEFISAWDLVGREQRKQHEPFFDAFIQACRAGGLPEGTVRSYLDYQITTDFLIANVDRHLNNFGVLRDPHSLDFISMAPLFDFGNSMFYQDPTMTRSRSAILGQKTKGFFSTQRRHIEHVQNLGCVDVGRLPSPEDVETFYREDQGLVDTGFNACIARGYEENLALLVELQGGVSYGKLIEQAL